MDEAGKLKLTCARCSQQWSYATHQPEISNNLRSSTVTLAHESFVRCPSNKCRQAYVLTILNATLSIQAQAVSDDIVEQVEGSKIVKPTLELIG